MKWAKRYIKMRQKIKNEQEQLFIFRDGSNLKAHHLRNLLRDILYSFKLEGNLYDTHSFRIGRATDLFKMGMDMENIKQMGRWKSNAVYKYLRQ